MLKLAQSVFGALDQYLVLVSQRNAGDVLEPDVKHGDSSVRQNVTGVKSICEDTHDGEQSDGMAASKPAFARSIGEPRAVAN